MTTKMHHIKVSKDDVELILLFCLSDDSLEIGKHMCQNKVQSQARCINSLV